jgi:glutaredoxin
VKLIELFTKDNCVFCEKAKSDLNKRWRQGLTIISYDIQTHTYARNDLMRRCEALGVTPKTVPLIFIDGKYIGGYNELVDYFDETNWEVSHGN